MPAGVGITGIAFEQHRVVAHGVVVASEDGQHGAHFAVERGAVSLVDELERLFQRPHQPIAALRDLIVLA